MLLLSLHLLNPCIYGCIPPAGAACTLARGGASQTSYGRKNHCFVRMRAENNTLVQDQGCRFTARTPPLDMPLTAKD